jgi:hypothetical protein
MKIQAKDLKVGDVISVPVFGVSVITAIEERYQKNGNMFYFVSTTFGPAKIDVKRNPAIADKRYEGAVRLKPETIVTIK